MMCFLPRSSGGVARSGMVRDWASHEVLSMEKLCVHFTDTSTTSNKQQATANHKEADQHHASLIGPHTISIDKSGNNPRMLSFEKTLQANNRLQASAATGTKMCHHQIILDCFFHHNHRSLVPSGGIPSAGQRQCLYDRGWNNKQKHNQAM